MARHSFYIWDYLVFGVTIVISLGIGIFYAFSTKKKTTTEYLVGGRAMKFFPVAISLLVSFESSIMMLGLPAEGYIYGIQYMWTAVGFFVAQVLSVFIMVPLIHPLKITSAYEYLEYRFNSRPVRLVGTVMGMLTYTWYMGIVLFGPAVALEAVTGFPQWSSIFVISLVSVIYTSIGGLKAVIWTDVFQAVVMLAGMLSILIKGTMVVGGPSEVWRVAEEGGRLNFFNFDVHPSTRHTFWNLCLASVIRGFGLIFNQSTIQRISSTNTVGEAKKVLLVVAPTFMLSLFMAVYEGIVAYAYYQTKGCDPFENKDITNANQIIPFTVMDIFLGMPGMPGLFLASLFSASLSTLSSGLSSLSALLWADIVSPLCPNISEAKATVIAKLSVVVFGIMASGIAVLVSMISGPLTQITGTLLSAFGAPLSGMFFLGCFAPRCTAKGCLIGALVGAIITSWIAMGMNFAGVPGSPKLPSASTESCPATNLFNLTTYEPHVTSDYTTPMVTGMTEMTGRSGITSPAPSDSGLSGIDVIYTLSYQWLGIVGIFSTIIVGLLVSYVTGANSPGDVDPRYLLALSDVLLFWVPGSVRSKVKSIGPQFIKEKYKDNFPDPALKHQKYNIEMEMGVAEEKAECLILGENGAHATLLAGEDTCRS